MKQGKICRELKVRLERHKNLIELLQNTALPQVERLAGSFPEESKVKPDDLSILLYQYHNELRELENLIGG